MNILEYDFLVCFRRNWPGQEPSTRDNGFKVVDNLSEARYFAKEFETAGFDVSIVQVAATFATCE